MTEASEFSREELDQNDDNVHGAISRRGYLDKCASHGGGLAVATSVLAALSPIFAAGQVIAPTDNRIATSHAEGASSSGSGMIRAYIAVPAGASPRHRHPVVLVIHENRGLNPH